MKQFHMPLPRALRKALVGGLVACAATVALGAENRDLGVSAVVPSASNCKFNNGAVALDFGTIDPASGSNATATATKTFKCGGSAANATFSISAGDGLHSSGPGARRMQHTTDATEFMAYSLSLSPTSATVPKNVDQTLTITGTIQPFEFQNVRAGTYQDTVVISITP